MGKHSVEQKSRRSKGNSKNNVRIITGILIVFLGVAMYLLFANKNWKVEKAVNNFFSAIKEDNNELANRYVDYEKLLCCLDELFSEKDNEQVNNVRKVLFKNITWSIDNIEIQNNQATVIVEVTNKDFKNIITKWMKELVVSKSLEKEITNELALKKLEKVLTEEQATKTVIEKVTLNKNNEDWKVEVNQDLRDLVYPGIDSVISVLETNENDK